MMIEFLQRYLQIDTTFPNPRYHDAVQLFAQQAARDGFDTNVVELSSGFPFLIISYEGTDKGLPSIALNHHMDVALADPTLWNSNPFSGTLKNQVLYGRGVQDMKGVGVVHYFALQQLKREGIKPRRSIHLFVAPDEERGGFKGTKLFIETPEFKKLNVGFVLDEAIPSGTEGMLLLKVSERKPIHARFTATGVMSHGSRLDSKNPIHDLTRFLAKLVQMHQEQNARMHDEPAGLLLSVNITSVQAGVMKNGQVALNVVPDVATATIDMRIPPQILLSQALEKLHSLLVDFPTITMNVEAIASDRDVTIDYKTSFYHAVNAAIQDCGLTTVPLFAEFASDLRFYFDQGIEGIGLTPFTTTNNIHGNNESVPVSDIELGKSVIYQILKSFCE